MVELIPEFDLIPPMELFPVVEPIPVLEPFPIVELLPVIDMIPPVLIPIPSHLLLSMSDYDSDSKKIWNHNTSTS